MSDINSEPLDESVHDAHSDVQSEPEEQPQPAPRPTQPSSKPAPAPQPKRQQQEAKAEASSSGDGEGQKSPAELTQNYLRLLNAGRLASKKKHGQLDGSMHMKAKTTMRPSDGGAGDSAGEAQLKSVWEAEIARLRSSTRNMDMQPLSSTVRSGSASRSRPGTAEEGVVSPRSPRGQAAGMSPRAASARSANTSPFQKLYTPGPGAYSPATTRYGAKDTSAFGFGTARQRPPHVCIQDSVVSPGPIYMPRKDGVSMLTSPLTHRFGKQFPGSRFEAGAELASNHPHWNPGPGQYEPASLANGRLRQPGLDAPKTVFGSATKLVTPQSNFSGTVFVSHGHSRRENVGVHSPGPAAYSPDTSPTRAAAADFTMGKKAPSYFDLYLDPQRQTSPGPVYVPKIKTWGTDPRATFGKAPPRWEPETNYAAAPFLTKRHERVNQGVHSPGPGVYSPEASKPTHVPTPLLASGPPDRFYNRFEPGRIQ
uniref:Uncharacterized protein n=1 Tax=Chlamydomonas leiostraca TaxID=1034604 RepID=A0A7S0RZR0_9CHLO|mmetsp:Transcript_36023/g.91013  ORF Transcript_36023/g.91013 Transcript_36023/m.91013 type:complete len:481 (+) Transcript_36023:129-1571(+)|eukprot:CAMPEP_0202882634 /NCGR_PEP_ID=MMETSP1391-20130828/38301_1 /ASSEMBLY_ACC=CAM_ASM_000867 /TAXON_ID=1034604 /ORGANISM="Chlamydomonas leiostraca, Strain SAG 11-49" /LENGTH=480 /DNA_ID=CAMNT_0049565529 /DNA_START=52 /DNA_END=1494 /DNA_ORIENTATION=+